MTEEQIRELRERINQVDDEFSRKANLLLDEIMLTDEQLERNSRQQDRNSRQIEECRNLIQENSRQIERNSRDIQDLRFTANQVLKSVSLLRQSQQTMAEQAAAEREIFQAEIRQIWEYLLSQKPNGKGDRPTD